MYEDRVQRAYNHLVLHCIRSGAEPPASVPHMIAWAARTPLAEWPADLSAAAIDGGEVLVDDGTRTPTQSCLEWAMPVADAAFTTPGRLWSRSLNLRSKRSADGLSNGYSFSLG